MDAALAQARTAFARYPPRAEMATCPHCPPESLDLRTFAFKAVTTWGDADDLRHFLPDLLELSWSGALGAPPAVVSAKLTAAGWRDWPPVEQAAVEDALRALFVADLAERPAPVGPRGAIAAVAEAGADLRRHLDDWHMLLSGGADERSAALVHLLDLLDIANQLDVAGGSLATLFWSPQPDATAVLAEWLLAHTMVLQLERAAFDYAGTPLAQPVARAARRLAVLRGDQ